MGREMLKLLEDARVRHTGDVMRKQMDREKAAIAMAVGKRWAVGKRKEWPSN